MEDDIIKRYQKENKTTKTEFCRRCDISLDTLKKLFQDKRRIRFTTLIKIKNVLGCSLDELCQDIYKFRRK